jgi:hypothetical protein
MKSRLAALVAASVFAGCAVASETIAPATDDVVATQTRHASPEQRREAGEGDVAHAARNPDSGAREEDLMVEAFWPFCGCSREEFDKLKADYATLRSAFEASEHDREDLRRSALTGRESLKYVDLLWTKKALLTLGHYDVAAVRQKGHDKVITTPEYDSLTIDAVKRFQCARYPKSSNKACDTRRTTGWMTFPEARESICLAGISAEDEVALQLAEWFAYGLVYNKHLDLSSTLVDALLENLKAHIQHTQSQQNGHFYPESYYQDIENRARIFKSKLEGLIDQEEEQIALRNKAAKAQGRPGDEARPKWSGPLLKDTVCRTPLQDVK